MKKSLPRLPGSTALADAVTELLATHLETMHQHAQEVLHNSDDTQESVHQLRVSSRRLGAVLRTFAADLPKKRVKRLRKRIRKVRRSAADARFADVLSQDLMQRLEKSSDNGSAHVARLLEWSIRKRQEARKPLRKRLRRLEEKEVWSWIARKFIQSPKLRTAAEEQLKDRAPGKVQQTLEDLYNAHARWHELDTFESLHRCRIALKHFRYTLEIFAGCFPDAPLAELEESVKSLQTTLGAINDSHEHADYLETLAERTKHAELAKSSRHLADYYHAKLSEQMRELERSWRTSLPNRLAGRTRALFGMENGHPRLDAEGNSHTMSEPASPRIYHLVWKSEWPTLHSGGDYRAASLKTEGFIHCTREPEKLVEVANLFFPERPEDQLLVIALDSGKIKPDIKYEDPGCGHLFPHIYGPLNLDAVESTHQLRRTNGSWSLPSELEG